MDHMFHTSHVLSLISLTPTTFVKARVGNKISIFIQNRQASSCANRYAGKS